MATACTPAPPTPRSILLITIDTLRADHVTAKRAPVLDRLARESLSFDTAITVAPLTLPSHASILTANYPPAHGVRDNSIYSLPANATTYTALLRARGYATAAFVSTVVLDRRYGLNAGFDVYDDELLGAPERPASHTLQRAQAWLDKREPKQPFFVWVHLFEPHAPYLSGSYASEVAVVDRELGEFFSRLRERKLWEDLVVSVTSDHGESLGEHGEQTHGFFVYDSTLRIPWILKAPDQKARRFAPQVRIVDVMPTMVDLANAGVTQPSATDGVNLREFIDAGRSPELEAYGETFLPRDQFHWSELRTLRNERVKYIAAPRPELYDLASDPHEQRNLIADRRAEGERLQQIVDAIERRRAAVASQSQSDTAIAEKFMSLGYIGYSPDANRSKRESLADPKEKLDVYSLTMKALELSEAGKAAEALTSLARAEQIDPGVTQVHYVKGSILGTEERYADAAAALERAVTLNPRFVLARFKLALAYVRLGRIDRAEEMLQTVLADEPRNVRALHNLAAVAYTRGDLARAERLEREALAIDRNYFEAWNTLGAIYLMGKQPDAAVDALNTAISLNASSGQAHYNLSLALKANGQANAAAATAATACTLDRQYCP